MWTCVRICTVCFVEYAQVTKMLGNGRLEAACFDGTKRLCHIRGKLRKKVCTCTTVYLYADDKNILCYMRNVNKQNGQR